MKFPYVHLNSNSQKPTPSNSHTSVFENDQLRTINDGEINVTKQTRTRGKKRKETEGKGKKKGKGKAKKRKQEEDNDSDLCSICYKGYIDGEEWVSCDVCLLWYHRQCAGVSDDEWIAMTEDTDVQFSCTFCKCKLLKL